MCSTTRAPARVLRTANGSENVANVSPGTSGRCSSTSWSPCTPLRPLRYTDFGPAALAAHCASKTRITGSVRGTAVPVATEGFLALVAAAYCSITAASSAPGKGPWRVPSSISVAIGAQVTRRSRVAPGSLSEAHDLEVERHLVLVRPAQRRGVDRRRLQRGQRRFVGHEALAGELVEDERKAVGQQRRRPVHHVEVEM